VHHVSFEAVPLVEAARIAEVQRVHRVRKDSILDADDQVEVIAHQAERGARPRRSFRNSSKLGEEGDAVAGVAKERGFRQ
jgi:hypothetical protein